MKPVALARWVALGALFAAPFLFLFVDGSLLFPYVAARGFGFRMLAEAAFAGWIVLAFSDRRYRPHASAIAVLLALFVVWMGVADAFALDPHAAFWGNLERMEGWVGLIHLLAFFIAATGVLGAEGLWRRWWTTFAIASALVCGYGVLQAAGLAPVARGAARIDALAGNPEFLGGYLLFAISATLWLAAQPGRVGSGRAAPQRLALFALAALQVFVLVQSGTRGALVALLAAVVLCLLVGSAAAGGRAARSTGLASLLVLVLLGSGLAWARAGGFLADHPILGRYLHMGVDDLALRFSLWRTAWEGFLARPLAGWGHEGFIHVFDRFHDPARAAAVEPWFDRAHNIYLDVLVAGGAPALGLFVALLGATAWRLWRSPLPGAARLALLGGLTAYAVQGLVVFDSLMTAMPLVALMAMANGPRPGVTPAALAPRPVGWIGLGAVGFAAIAVGWAVNVPTATASRNVIRALAPADGGPLRLGYLRRAADAPGFAGSEVRVRLVRTAVVVAGAVDAPEPDRTLFLDYATRQAVAGLEASPYDVRLRLELARLHHRLGRLDAAWREVAAALAEAPRDPRLLAERDRLVAVKPP